MTILGQTEIVESVIFYRFDGGRYCITNYTDYVS